MWQKLIVLRFLYFFPKFYQKYLWEKIDDGSVIKSFWRAASANIKDTELYICFAGDDMAAQSSDCIYTKGSF